MSDESRPPRDRSWARAVRAPLPNRSKKAVSRPEPPSRADTVFWDCWVAVGWEVYRALDLILNQPVALKFLLRAAHTGEAALARFRNEVRIARQVSHPNVCRVYDIGFIEGLHFLSMEYVDGENLVDCPTHLLPYGDGGKTPSLCWRPRGT